MNKQIIELATALWAYKGFIANSVKREFQLKYQNSLLGAAWTILNPLAMIIVYTIIFAQIMRTRLPGVDNTFGYSVYLCAGVLTWGLFSEIVTRGQGVFFEFSNILKKISFPRICLPVIVTLSAILNFVIIFTIFTLFLLLTNNFPGIVYVYLFPILFIQIIFSIGLAILLGVLNVFFRDVGHVFTIIMQFWFWLTPIVYPANILPHKIQFLLALNPMAVMISGYHDILVTHTLPPLFPLLVIFIGSLLLCAFSMRLFRKHSGELVDEL